MKVLGMPDMIRCFIEGFNARNMDALQWTIQLFTDGFRPFRFDFLGSGKMSLAHIQYDGKKVDYAAYSPGDGYCEFKQRGSDGKLEIVERKIFIRGREPAGLQVTTIPLVSDTFDYNEFIKVPEIEHIELNCEGHPFRYSVTTSFSNGEKRKYFFPFVSDGDLYNDHRWSGSPFCFTDKIFMNGWVSNPRIHPPDEANDEKPYYGAGLNFVNGFSISALELYYDGVECPELIEGKDSLA